MENVFVSTRHNGKSSVSLHLIELAVAKNEPINFDIYGYQARYVPERTCKNANTKKPYAIFFRCSACGYPKTDAIDVQMLVEEIKYCPNCGARVVE